MGLFSWVGDVAGWITGSGNEPGTPDTRKLGYDPGQVADATAIDLAATVPPNVQKELLLMGVAGLAVMLLLHPKHSKGPS